MKPENARMIIPATALKERDPAYANNPSEAVCCVCHEEYSFEDSMVFTECCDIAIGHHCNAQHIEATGECWNCGEKEVQSETASEVESWVSYDPKDFDRKPGVQSLYAKLGQAARTGHYPATTKLHKNSTIIDSTSTNTSNSQESAQSRPKKTSFLGVNEEQCAREVPMYESQNTKESPRDAKARPQFSPLSMDGDAEMSNTLGRGLDNAMAAPSDIQSSLFIRSDAESSDLFQDDDQQERQDAKHYVIDATKHLVDMCNSYGNLIDEDDASEVIDEILRAVNGE